MKKRFNLSFASLFIALLALLISIMGNLGTVQAVVSHFSDHVRVFDDKDLEWGGDASTSGDIRARYDEAGDNRLELHDGTNLLAHLTDAGTTGDFVATGDLSTGDWELAEGTGDLDFGPSADPNAFTFDDDGDFHLTAGDLEVYDDIQALGTSDAGAVEIGLNDTRYGQILAYGNNGTVGGIVDLYAAADHDGTYNYYRLRPQNGYLEIGPDTDTDAFKLDGDGDLHLTAGDLATVGGGDVIVGADGATKGAITLWDGAGGNTPGYIKIYSPNGTAWYIYVEDDGTVGVHNAVPTTNGDGDPIGDQTD